MSKIKAMALMLGALAMAGDVPDGRFASPDEYGPIETEKTYNLFKMLRDKRYRNRKDEILKEINRRKVQ